MENLRPIGTVFKYVFSPYPGSTTSHHDLFEYKVIKHSAYSNIIDGPPVGVAESLHPISHKRIESIAMVSFAGRIWWIPPTDIWEYCTPDYKDVFRAIECGIINIPGLFDIPLASNKPDYSRSLVERVSRAIAAHRRNVSHDSPEIDEVWIMYCGQAKKAIDVVLDTVKNEVRIERELIAEYVSRNLMSCDEYSNAIREVRYMSNIS